MVMLRDLAWQRLAPAPPPAPPGLAYVVKPLGTRRDVVGPVAEWLAAWASRTGLRFTERPLDAMPLAAQLAAVQTTAVLVTPAGSSYNALAVFLPGWTAVVVLPQCGGCDPAAPDLREGCDADSLYARPCTVEEFGIDVVWPRPALRILRYPATLEETVPRAGHLDVVVSWTKLEPLLEEARALAAPAGRILAMRAEAGLEEEAVPRATLEPLEELEPRCAGDCAACVGEAPLPDAERREACAACDECGA